MKSDEHKYVDVGQKPFMQRFKSQHWSAMLMEGLLVLIAVFVAGSFLSAPYTAPTENMDAAIADLQLTLDAQETALSNQSNPLDVENLKAEALENLRQGKYAATIAQADVILELDTQDGWTHFLRAIAYRKLEDYQAAVADYDKAIMYGYNHDYVYNDRGIAYSLLGWQSQAIADYDYAIAISPDYNAPHLNRGIAYEQWGNNKAAAKSYWEWIKRSSTNRLAMSTLESGETLELEMSRGLVYAFPFEASAGETIKVMANAVPAQSVDPLILILDPNGTPLVGTDDVGNSWNSMLNDYPLPVSGVYVVLLHHAGGETEGTLALTLERSSALPMDLGTMKSEAWHDLLADDYPETIEGYTRILEVAPESIAALNNRGIAYDSQEQYGQALADYNRAIELAPENAGPYLNRGITYEKMDNTEAAAINYWTWIHLNGTEVVDGALTNQDRLEIEMSEGRVYSYTFDAEAEQKVSVMVRGVPAQSVDPMFLIVDSEGLPVVGTDDTGQSYNASLSGFALPSSGPYTLLVHHAGGGSEGDMILSFQLSGGEGYSQSGHHDGYGCPGGGHGIGY